MPDWLKPQSSTDNTMAQNSQINSASNTLLDPLVKSEITPTVASPSTTENLANKNDGALPAWMQGGNISENSETVANNTPATPLADPAPSTTSTDPLAESTNSGLPDWLQPAATSVAPEKIPNTTTATETVKIDTNAGANNSSNTSDTSDG